MNDELVGMAYPYALDALDDSERRELDTDLATTDEDTRSTFTDEVRRIREAFAVVSAVGPSNPRPGCGRESSTRSGNPRPGRRRSPNAAPAGAAGRSPSPPPRRSGCSPAGR
ncbi:RskA family anti-sigma factor [Rhodococcus opacus]|uniref:RskA family anti-sigma factor n=1 Tax=Rhodococcus opacus TaxID=37919 RepID=UPI003F67FC55